MFIPKETVDSASAPASTVDWGVDLSSKTLLACKSCEGDKTVRSEVKPVGQIVASSDNLEPVDVLVVVDGSGSMNSTFGAESKLDAGKSALGQLLVRMPKNCNLALRVFGEEGLYWKFDGFGQPDSLSRVDINRSKEPCEQSSLLVDLEDSSNKLSMLNSSLQMLKAQGEQTNLGYALEQAEHDLYKTNPLRKKVIVLITDGGETCGVNPCEFVKQMRLRHPDLHIDVIALTINDHEQSNVSGINIAAGNRRPMTIEETREQLKCIAEEGGGKYWNPADSTSLNSTLLNTIQMEVQGKIMESNPNGGK